MYSLLSTLLQGRLLSLVRSVENSNGLEALRQLLRNCQPHAREPHNGDASELDGLSIFFNEELYHGPGCALGRELQSVREDGRQDDRRDEGGGSPQVHPQDL